MAETGKKRYDRVTKQLVEAARMCIAREILVNGPDSPRVPELRELFQIAVHDDRVARLAAQAPPASPEKRRKLALMLRPEPEPVTSTPKPVTPTPESATPRAPSQAADRSPPNVPKVRRSA